MNKKLFPILLLLACAFSFCACSDDDDSNENKTPEYLRNPTAFVINQGNYYSNIAGSIEVLNGTTSTLTDSAFFNANGILPGNTLQTGLIFNNKFWAIAYQSNVLFVADLELNLKKTVKVEAPRAIAANGNYLYISNYNGYVTRVDASTLTVKDSIKVGPNPEEMAVANGYLYVTNSDGLNYLNNYAEGKSVSKINLSSFKVEKTIEVGLNPTKCVADSLGNVFIVVMGDYGAIPATIQKITQDDRVEDFANATNIAVDGKTLYAINSVTDWNTYQTVNTYFKIDTETGVRTDLLKNSSDGVKHPIAIGVNPTNKEFFITSFNDGTYGSDYSGPAYMNEYSKDGSLIKTYTTGINPVAIVFVKK